MKKFQEAGSLELSSEEYRFSNPTEPLYTMGAPTSNTGARTITRALQSLSGRVLPKQNVAVQDANPHDFANWPFPVEAMYNLQVTLRPSIVSDTDFYLQNIVGDTPARVLLSGEGDFQHDRVKILQELEAIFGEGLKTLSRSTDFLQVPDLREQLPRLIQDYAQHLPCTRFTPMYSLTADQLMQPEVLTLTGFPNMKL